MECVKGGQLKFICIWNELRRVRLFPQVRLPVKVRKHDNHEGVLQETHKEEGRGIRTVPHQEWASKVNKEDEELQQLDLRDVPLPPGRDQLGSDACDQVVGVHDRMDEHIHDGHQSHVSNVHVPHRVVAGEAHHRVVVDVEEGHVARLLPQHEEERIQEIGELQQEVGVGQQGVDLVLPTPIWRHVGLAPQTPVVLGVGFMH